MGQITHKSGFSLIELLVVAALMGMLSIGIVSVFLITLRGSNRAKMEAELRSQGDLVTTTIERNLRNAVSWTDCTPPDNTISYRLAEDADGAPLRTYTFAANTITANGQPLLDNSEVRMSNPVLRCKSSDGISSGYVVVTFDLTATRSLGEPITQSFQARVAMRTMK